MGAGVDHRAGKFLVTQKALNGCDAATSIEQLRGAGVAKTVWIDGAQQASLSGVDNDTRRIDRARLGALTGIDTGTSGTYYFDDFESRRQTYIGP